MSKIEPPKIEKKDFELLFADYVRLMPYYTNQWNPKPQNDVGIALSKLFFDILGDVINRLNKVPDRNFISYLNMLGFKLLPPKAASAPVTISPAEGVTAEVLIPKGTKMSAPSDTAGTLVFETDSGFMSTTAKILQVFHWNRKYDELYSFIDEYLAESPFSIFKRIPEKDLQQHAAYFGHPDIFNLRPNSTIMLRIYSDQSKLGSLSELVQNTYVTRWELLTKDPQNPDPIAYELIVSSSPSIQSGYIELSLDVPADVGEIKKTKVNGTESFWLRFRLVSPNELNINKILEHKISHLVRSNFTNIRHSDVKYFQKQILSSPRILDINTLARLSVKRGQVIKFDDIAKFEEVDEINNIKKLTLYERSSFIHNKLAYLSCIEIPEIKMVCIDVRYSDVNIEPKDCCEKMENCCVVSDEDEIDVILEDDSTTIPLPLMPDTHIPVTDVPVTDVPVTDVPVTDVPVEHESVIRIITDKDEYEYGESLNISVEYFHVDSDSLILEIFDGRNNAVYEKQIPVAESDSGTSIETIALRGSEWKQPGEQYRLVIQHRGKTFTKQIKRKMYGFTIEREQNVYSWMNKVSITIVAPDFNFDPELPDEIGVDEEALITISTGKGKITGYKLIETGPNTGIFTGEITLTGSKELAEALKLEGIHGVTSSAGSGPTDGLIACGNTDSITISFKTRHKEDSITSRISWHEGSVHWDKATYPVNSQGIIKVIDPDMDLDPKNRDRILVQVISTSDSIGITLSLGETGNSTGIFENFVHFTTTEVSSGNRLRVKPGDKVTAIYVDKTNPEYPTVKERNIPATTTIERDEPNISLKPINKDYRYGQEINIAGKINDVQPEKITIEVWQVSVSNDIINDMVLVSSVPSVTPKRNGTFGYSYQLQGSYWKNAQEKTKYRAKLFYKDKPIYTEIFSFGGIR